VPRAALAVLLLLAAPGSCGNVPGPSTAPVAPEGARGDAGVAVRPTVSFLRPSAPEARVSVALARTEEERRRGLMYVQNLPPDDGMLFIFEADAEQNFWMKNTLITLDMIFISSDLTVVGVVANAKPLSLTPRGVGKPSRYVLEVNGGWAGAHGVEAGTKVRFDNLP
jgi:uncharacterized membrane protein (UPF0127 family)